MARRVFSLFSCLSAAVLAAGCATVENDLAGENAKRLRSWDEAVDVAAENREPAGLSWATAVDVMLRHNPELQRAKLDRVNARRDAKRVWQQLLPYFTLQANRYSHVNDRELRDFSATQFSADVALYLDRFARLPRDLYGVALTQVRADMAWRMAVKMRLLELYGRCEALAAVRDAAARTRALDELMARHPLYFAGRDRDFQHIASLQFDEKIRSAEDDLRATLGVQHETVRVDAATLPAWAASGERLLAAGLPQEGNAAFIPDPDWVGLMAVEGAGILARRRGILLNNWPNVSVYLSLPGIFYDSRNGFAPVDFAQTTVNASVYWSPNWILDTRDQLERAADEEKLMRVAFESQTDLRLRQMATQARVLRESKRRAGELEKRLAAARQVAPKLPPQVAAELAERALRWEAERDEIGHARRAGLVQLWFLSDNNKEILPHEAFEQP